MPAALLYDAAPYWRFRLARMGLIMSVSVSSIDQCAGLFELGSVQDARQCRRADSLDLNLSLRVRTSSGEWLLKMFDEKSAGAEDVRFMAGYAAELAARELTPPLRRSPDGEQLVRTTLGGRTYQVLCRPWIRGEAVGPEEWRGAYLSQVGQFLARMHGATSGWQPEASRPAWNYSMTPGQAMGRIAAWGLMGPDDLAYLDRVAAKITEAMSMLPVGQQIAIHGDPWHGNLLLCNGRLQVLDFWASGVGPRAGDVAVWFYWTVNSFGASGWGEPFDMVLSAYESMAPLADGDKAVIPYLACVRRLWFLVEEVQERMACAPEDREAVDFYVRDHLSAVRTIEGLGLLGP